MRLHTHRSAVITVCAILLAALALGAAADGVELLVPRDYATIQEAIDAAVPGTVIVVSPGTYRENLDFRGKTVTVRSTNPDDPDVVESTIIDGDGLGTTVTFAGGEGPDTVLEGFTITNGYSTQHGGGIVVAAASAPTIRKNHILRNIATNHGGGIDVRDGSAPRIASNRITGNAATQGGGIRVFEASAPVIVDNVIAENVASAGGGGMVIQRESTPVIRGNTFHRNVAANQGGGIVLGNSPALIEGNVFEENRSNVGGGISAVNFSSPTIQGNTFIANQALANAGGIFATPNSEVIGTDGEPWARVNTPTCTRPGNDDNDYEGNVHAEGILSDVVFQDGTNC